MGHQLPSTLIDQRDISKISPRTSWSPPLRETVQLTASPGFLARIESLMAADRVSFRKAGGLRVLVVREREVVVHRGGGVAWRRIW